MERPAGPAVYAGYVLDLLSRTGQVEVVGWHDVARADAVLSLDGRFRAGRGQPTVTAVLDLGHVFEPGGYGRLERLAQHWRVVSASRRSDCLLAPSEAVRFGLVRYLRVPESRVALLPPVPAQRFRRPAREAVAALRGELHLPDRYLLFVGTRSRRKNLALLARAWEQVAGRLGTGVGLVLAGPGSGGVPGAHDLGYVSAERLPALIGGAVAWVCPSLYEGCALGALEAMACGTPALVAGTGALARAVGPAGLVLDQHDAAAWVGAMLAVSRDAGLRAELAAGGLKIVAQLRSSAPDPRALLEALSGAAAAAR